MTEPSTPDVVELVDAGVPADQGLSSLGLLMQLGGGIFTALGACVMFLMLLMLRARGHESLWLLIVCALAVGRSLSHRSAGSQLLYGPGNRLAGVRRYIVVAFVQTVITGAISTAVLGLPVRMSLSFVAALAVWPTVLAIVLTLPRFRRFHHELPITEDKGFEGAAILMTVLGACGLLGGGAALYMLLEMPGYSLQQGMTILIVLATAMLVVRSILHLRAGLSGLRETSIDHSVELANRYSNFGMIASFCWGGALLLFMMQGPVVFRALLIVCGSVWLLMTWPVAIRRFFSDRQFADLLAGSEAPVHRRAPDAGLTGLGWLLVAFSAYAGSFSVLALIGDSSRGGHADFGELTSLIQSAGEHSPWWSVGEVILQAWAGFELVRMSAQSRMIATAYGAVGVALTLYLQWPALSALLNGRGASGPAMVVVIVAIAVSLVLPIATILLVHRKITPTARARFRTQPAR